MNVFRCPRCDKEFQSDVTGLVKCPSCQAEVQVNKPPLMGAPWDNREGGWVNAYVRTIKLSLGQPTYFFDGMGRGDGFWRPLAFALVNAMIVAILVAAYQLGFQTFLAGANLAISFETLASPLAVLSAPVAVLVGLLIMIFFVPMVTCAGVFISAGIYHLCLMILGAANRPFVQTFRTTCYATGPQLMQILPVAGGMIAAVWQLVLTIMGLKVVHRTTYGKTVLAVFLPLILCCSIVVLFVALIAGGLVGAIMSAASTTVP